MNRSTDRAGLFVRRLALMPAESAAAFTTVNALTAARAGKTHKAGAGRLGNRIAPVRRDYNESDRGMITGS